MRRDEETWRTRVRRGGILAGHDFANADCPGVRRAVSEAFGQDRVQTWGSCWWVEITEAADEEITFLVANFNKRPYLNDCIESLVQQTDPHWRCLIADDGSTDGSAEFLRAHPAVRGDGRFTVLECGENCGYAATLARLIEEASTDIVGILDADDALHLECVRRVLDCYRQAYRGFVYTNFMLCDAHLHPRRRGWCRAVPAGESILTTDCASHLKTFRRREYAKTDGLDRCAKTAEDKDLVYKLEEVAEPFFIDKPLYYHRRGVETSLTAGQVDFRRRSQTQLVRRRAEQRRKRSDLARNVPQLVPESALKILLAGAADAALLDAIGWRRDRQIVLLCAEGDQQRRRHSQIEGALSRRELRERIEEGERFDCIIDVGYAAGSDSPIDTWREFGDGLSDKGMLIAAAPNARHGEVIRGLVQGRWEPARHAAYGEATERLYTRRELEKSLWRAGLAVSGAGDRGEAEVTDAEIPAATAAVDGGRFQIPLAPGETLSDVESEWLLAAATPQSLPDFDLTSIVILTHNQREYTRRCLASIRWYTDEPYELIVVDNASDDGTVEFLRAQADVASIENPDNRGFPAGCNQGIAAARGGQILLLNNDVVVTTGWLRRMLSALHGDDSVGLVGPCSNSVSGPQQVEVDYDDLLDLDGFAWRWAIEHDAQQVEIHRLVGFCLLIRREVIDAVGLLDEQFGIGNFEDDDYCRRAIAAGFKAVIARDAFIHHYGSVTFRSFTNLGAILAENERRYRKKWESGESGASGASVDAIERSREQGAPDSETQYTCRAGESGGLLLAPRACLLSLCMIVRDAERTLADCLESVRPWVDELVIVDTGSRDRTIEIAKRFGARLFHFPWCDDFAAARNESLAQARGTWLFWMDADDTISANNGRKLRELACGPHDEKTWGYIVQVHCPHAAGQSPHDVTAVDHVKLLRNRPEIRFEFRIHEQVLPSIRAGGGEVAWTDLFVTHSGSDRTQAGRRAKQQRDLRLLKMELHDRPDHPFALFNLGMTLADMGEHARAVDALQRGLEAAGPHESHVRKLYALLIGSCMQIGRHDAARQYAQQALELFSDDPELSFRAGMLAHDAGDRAAAEKFYLAALDGNTSGERHFSSRDRGVTGFKARYNLAVVLVEQGRWTDAQRQLRAAIDEAPQFAPSWSLLGEVLLHQNQPSAAQELARQILARPELRREGLLLQAQAALAADAPADARASLQQAVQQFGDDPQVWDAWSRFVFEHGGMEEAEAALLRLSGFDGQKGAAFHNLGAVYMCGGRAAEAARAYEASLQFRPQAAHTCRRLSDAYRALGRRDDARRADQRAEQLNHQSNGRADVGNVQVPIQPRV